MKLEELFQEYGATYTFLLDGERIDPKTYDIDVENQEALRGSERVKEAIRNYVYLTSNANMGFNYGTLKLMKDISKMSQ